MTKHITILLILIHLSVFGQDSLKVTSPNGGEIWVIGSPYFITWDDNILSNIEILLFKNDILVRVIDSNSASDGTFTWIVSAAVASGNDYKVMVASLNDGTIFDFSDTEFAITDATSVGEQFSGIPGVYQLMQNYPNPFNPTTTIYYALPKAGLVELVVYDVLGNEVVRVNEEKSAGHYKYEFDGSEFKSGVYFYSIKAGDFVEAKKMVLMK